MFFPSMPPRRKKHAREQHLQKNTSRSSPSFFTSSWECSSSFRSAASYFFKSQYSLISTTNIQEIYQSGSVQSIFQNNLTVLFVCFVTAFLFGIGAMFLFIVVWNGSVGGVVFGAVAKIAAINAGASPSLVFIILLVSVLPHVIIEMGAYFLAGVAGENTSSFLFFNKKQKKVHQFELSYSCSILIASIILLLLGSIVEKILPNLIFG